MAAVHQASERRISNFRFKFIKVNIYLFDYASEIIQVASCATMFVYTEYETSLGFILNIVSTLVDWYFSHLELKTLDELKAYTE